MQHGLISTMERGCEMARCVNGRHMLSNKANGKRNRVHKIVMRCWRRVYFLDLSVFGSIIVSESS